MQRQVMQCVFPQMWSTTQNWAHPPGQPMHAKYARPNSVVVSQKTIHALLTMHVLPMSLCY